MPSLRPVKIGAFAIGVLLGTCPGAGPGDFTITLKVQAGGREQTALSGQSAAARPSIAAGVKENLWVQWSAVNAAATPLSDVTLHVFMDRGDVRAEAPKPGPQTVYESALILDFEPGSKSSGAFRMSLSEPGSYLVRAETIGAAKQSGKETAAAMQVAVR